MQQQELRDQEQNRHEERVDRNIEHQQAMHLDERNRGITAANQNSTVARIVNIVFFIFGVIELVLLLRIILKLAGVNAANGFASLIYGISAPFVALFQTLLVNPSLGGASILEFTTMIAMLVWAILAWLVTRVIWLLMSRPR